MRGGKYNTGDRKRQGKPQRLNTHINSNGQDSNGQDKTKVSARHQLCGQASIKCLSKIGIQFGAVCYNWQSGPFFKCWSLFLMVVLDTDNTHVQWRELTV